MADQKCGRELNCTETVSYWIPKWKVFNDAGEEAAGQAQLSPTRRFDPRYKGIRPVIVPQYYMCDNGDIWFVTAQGVLGCKPDGADRIETVGTIKKLINWRRAHSNPKYSTYQWCSAECCPSDDPTCWGPCGCDTNTFLNRSRNPKSPDWNNFDPFWNNYIGFQTAVDRCVIYWKSKSSNCGNSFASYVKIWEGEYDGNMYPSRWRERAQICRHEEVNSCSATDVSCWEIDGSGVSMVTYWDERSYNQGICNGVESPTATHTVVCDYKPMPCGFRAWHYNDIHLIVPVKRGKTGYPDDKELNQIKYNACMESEEETSLAGFCPSEDYEKCNSKPEAERKDCLKAARRKRDCTEQAMVGRYDTFRIFYENKNVKPLTADGINCHESLWRGNAYSFCGGRDILVMNTNVSGGAASGYPITIIQKDQILMSEERPYNPNTAGGDCHFCWGTVGVGSSAKYSLNYIYIRYGYDNNTIVKVFYTGGGGCVEVFSETKPNDDPDILQVCDCQAGSGNGYMVLKSGSGDTYQMVVIYQTKGEIARVRTGNGTTYGDCHSHCYSNTADYFVVSYSLSGDSKRYGDVYENGELYKAGAEVLYLPSANTAYHLCAVVTDTVEMGFGEQFWRDSYVVSQEVQWSYQGASYGYSLDVLKYGLVLGISGLNEKVLLSPSNFGMQTNSGHGENMKWVFYQHPAYPDHYISSVGKEVIADKVLISFEDSKAFFVVAGQVVREQLQYKIKTPSGIETIIWHENPGGRGYEEMGVIPTGGGCSGCACSEENRAAIEERGYIYDLSLPGGGIGESTCYPEDYSIEDIVMNFSQQIPYYKPVYYQNYVTSYTCYSGWRVGNRPEGCGKDQWDGCNCTQFLTEIMPKLGGVTTELVQIHGNYGPYCHSCGNDEMGGFYYEGAFICNTICRNERGHHFIESISTSSIDEVITGNVSKVRFLDYDSDGAKIFDETATIPTHSAQFLWGYYEIPDDGDGYKQLVAVIDTTPKLQDHPVCGVIEPDENTDEYCALCGSSDDGYYIYPPDSFCTHSIRVYEISFDKHVDNGTYQHSTSKYELIDEFEGDCERLMPDEWCAVQQYRPQFAPGKASGCDYECYTYTNCEQEICPKEVQTSQFMRTAWIPFHEKYCGRFVRSTKLCDMYFYTIYGKTNDIDSQYTAVLKYKGRAIKIDNKELTFDTRTTSAGAQCCSASRKNNAVNYAIIQLSQKNPSYDSNDPASGPYTLSTRSILFYGGGKITEWTQNHDDEVTLSVPLMRCCQKYMLIQFKQSNQNYTTTKIYYAGEEIFSTTKMGDVVTPDKADIAKQLGFTKWVEQEIDGEKVQVEVGDPSKLGRYGGPMPINVWCCEEEGNEYLESEADAEPTFEDFFVVEFSDKFMVGNKADNNICIPERWGYEELQYRPNPHQDNVVGRWMTNRWDAENQPKAIMIFYAGECLTVNGCNENDKDADFKSHYVYYDDTSSAYSYDAAVPTDLPAELVLGSPACGGGNLVFCANNIYWIFDKKAGLSKFNALTFCPES
ncbi:MAG: hypothetical protein LBP59_10350 [Planctomycetaceae bacterium]|jgi:hypothetical protein|nr:hypothetical protein [Planctomycetaceae bacterium]